MKNYVMPAALLSLLLAAGCSGGGNSTQNEPNEAPAAAEGAPAASERTDGAQATGGTRVTRPPAARPAPVEREPPAPRSPAPAPRAEFVEVTIPEGTALPLELESALSSETAQIETPVRARLKQSVIVHGVTALPAGAVFNGEVTAVERAGRVKGRSSLAFMFSRVQADNLSGDLRTNVLSYMGEASKGEDATKIGVGAAGGAIIGGLLGGKDGAAKGAAIGGGAGTGVVLATRGKEVELVNGADLAATLAAPFTIRVPVR